MVFEDEPGRDGVRKRLLRAAQKHGIVPVGFIAGQLRVGRQVAPLPTGQLALLFADIEGSSALLQALQDAYPVLLGNVRGVLRSCARRLGGHEVDAYGDEFFAVFRHAEDALAAAIEIHRGLRDGTWPGDTSPRMRVGIHVGRPTLTEHGYVGLAIHGAARIMAAAHGSQILLSEATVRALRPSLPPDIELRPMGVHHLRGVSNEALYQAVVADLPSDFPPIRATPVP